MSINRQPFDLPNVVAGLAILGWTSPIQIFEQSSEPTAPSAVAFWRNTTVPNKLYVSMVKTGGSWDWIPLANAP